MSKKNNKMSIIVEYIMWKILKQEALDRDISIKDVIKDMMEQKGLI